MNRQTALAHRRCRALAPGALPRAGATSAKHQAKHSGQLAALIEISAAVAIEEGNMAASQLEEENISQL